MFSVTFTKKEIQQSVEEAKKIGLRELKRAQLMAAKYPILAERQHIMEMVKRKQSEVRKFAAFLKRKINDS